MGDPGDSDLAPQTDRKARRWAALLLSFVGPGLGHLAIGYPRRMVAWYFSALTVVAWTLLGAAKGVYFTIPIGIAIALAVRIAAAIDTVRLRRPASLPRPRTVVLIAVGLSVFMQILSGHVKSKVVEAFQIPSGAMYPTLEVGDHIFATKLGQTYGVGDVVVFLYPMEPTTKYLKRIVAVAGDHVEIRVGDLIVNDQRVPRAQTSRPCVPTGEHSACTIWDEELGGRRYGVAHEGSRMASSFGPVVVPPGHVFVLGDNRDNSSDSRVWGPLKVELIVGKVTGVWWSQGSDGIRWNRVNLRID